MFNLSVWILTVLSLISLSLIKTDDFDGDINSDPAKWFDKSNYEQRWRKTPFWKKQKSNQLNDRWDTKFAIIAPKTHGCIVQKDDHEIKEPEFTKGKGVKKSVSNTQWLWYIRS